MTIAAILVCAAVVLVMTPYPSFRGEMQAARDRLMIQNEYSGNAQIH